MSFLSVAKQITTEGFSSCHNITSEVVDAVRGTDIKAGLVTIFIPGSTAGITTIEFEDGAVSDLVDVIEKIAPTEIHYKHDQRWGDGNGFSHVRAAIIGPSITVPLENGKLLLGQWQQIVLIDFDNRSRNRTYLVNILGE